MPCPSPYSPALTFHTSQDNLDISPECKILRQKGADFRLLRVYWRYRQANGIILDPDPWQFFSLHYRNIRTAETMWLQTHPEWSATQLDAWKAIKRHVTSRRETEGDE